MHNPIEDSLAESQQALERFRSQPQNIANIQRAADLLIGTLEAGNSIYSCGNGGSMSDAMHFAEELSGRYRQNRRGLSAQAISDPASRSRSSRQ